MDDQEVKLNIEHSDYKWVSIEEAMNLVAFPGQSGILEQVEKEFIKKKPTDWLLIKVKAKEDL